MKRNDTFVLFGCSVHFLVNAYPFPFAFVIDDCFGYRVMFKIRVLYCSRLILVGWCGLGGWLTHALGGKDFVAWIGLWILL